MSKKTKKSRKISRVVLIVLCLVLVAVGVLYVFGPRKQVIDAVYQVTEIELPATLPWENPSEEGGQALARQPASDSSQTASAVPNVSDVSEEAPLPSRSQGNIASDESSVPVSGSFSRDALPASLEIPLCRGNSQQDGTGSDHEIHRYAGFTLCYRESYEQPEWVAYEINREELNKVAERGDNFRADPSISTGSASLADYKGSGYDRGHLAPAADMAWSEETMSESFYMSNMSPQVPGFNRGVWKNLEEEVRNWVEAFDSVYIVTGPILEKEQYPTIGENKVAVPEYYYKVLFAPTGAQGEPQMIGFILPNEKSDQSFYSYAVPVDQVEERTGLDFFHVLEDSQENLLEAEAQPELWVQ